VTTKNPADIRASARKRSAADYGGTIRSFYPFWDSMYRPFLLGAVEALPVGRFHWKPRPELFTAHQIIVHIAECERGWIHNTLEGGTYEEWVVPHEDPAQGWVTVHDAPDHEALFAMLAEWHGHTQGWLDRPVSELSRVVTSRIPGRPEQRYTLHWILDLVQQHEIHHRAQLILYLRLMGLTPPPSM
jgi:uncharacterized damage-inducible protein DinB